MRVNRQARAGSSGDRTAERGAQGMGLSCIAHTTYMCVQRVLPSKRFGNHIDRYFGEFKNIL
jgi:hypothetical protein